MTQISILQRRRVETLQVRRPYNLSTLALYFASIKFALVLANGVIFYLTTRFKSFGPDASKDVHCNIRTSENQRNHIFTPRCSS